MSRRRGSISDYPEHLNPFYEGNEKFRFWKFGKVKRSGSIGEALRNTLIFKSFRGKKKDKEIPSATAASELPELRRHDSINAHHRQTLPTTMVSPATPAARNTIALPRSRFNERVGKLTVDSKEDISNGHISCSTPELTSINPFEGNENVGDLKPRRLRGRKRRAPLPPNMTKEEGDAYLGVSSLHNVSKWSLTSVETDISTYSEYENDHLVVDDSTNHEMAEMMHSITKEMEKLTDDVNENTDIVEADITKEDKPQSDVPDLIASSTEINKAKNSSCDISTNMEVDEKTDKNSNLLSSLENSNNEENTVDCNDPENNKCIVTKENHCTERERKSDLPNDFPNNSELSECININQEHSIYIIPPNNTLNNVDILVAEANKEVIDTNFNEDDDNLPKNPIYKTEVMIETDISSKEKCIEVAEKENELEVNGNENDDCKPIPRVRSHTSTKRNLLENNN